MTRRLALLLAALLAAPAFAGEPPSSPAGVDVAFDDLPGVASDDLAAAFAVFRASCVADATPRRAAKVAPVALRAICARALALRTPVDGASASAFFAASFVPRRLEASAFFTGYYEPVVEGSLTRNATFATPLLAVPADLVAGAPGAIARLRLKDGTLAAMPDRAAIETGALGAAAVPLVWLREPVDAFFVQVQGSARIVLPDGTTRRLAYAGRNGYPYTSIGKVLVDTLHIPPDKMGMTELKGWIRAHGEGPDDAGTELMRKNRSFIFFRFDDALPPEAGPVGAANVSLTPLRSLAIDRNVWSYGLPFYVAADLPWESETPSPFRRLMVAQDTGSAIVGPARADIFFGTGATAAARAGPVREPGALFVLWPRVLAGKEPGRAATKVAR